MPRTPDLPSLFGLAQSSPPPGAPRRRRPLHDGGDARPASNSCSLIFCGWGTLVTSAVEDLHNSLMVAVMKGRKLTSIDWVEVELFATSMLERGLSAKTFERPSRCSHRS